MRRLFLELYYKQTFPSTPITSFSPFLSYIVVTPLMIGFEKDFSCHSHLGSIRIPLLFPFPPEPFPRNDKESGTLELYYLSAYCLPKILLLQLVGHRVIQISRVFCAFPMLQLPYQFDRSGMDRLNILLGSLVLTLLCGIHSRSALGVTSSSGWNSSQNPTTSPTLLPPTVSRTSIETEGFHVLSSIGYSSLFVSLYLAFDGKVLPLYRLSFPKIHASQVDLVWTSLFPSFFIKCKWPNLICQGHASSCALTLLGLPSLFII